MTNLDNAEISQQPIAIIDSIITEPVKEQDRPSTSDIFSNMQVVVPEGHDVDPAELERIKRHMYKSWDAQFTEATKKKPYVNPDRKKVKGISPRQLKKIRRRNDVSATTASSGIRINGTHSREA